MAALACRSIGLALIALSACACVSPRTVDSLEQCAQSSNGWELSADPPDNHSELMSLQSGGKTVRSQLEAGVPLREAWFSRGPDDLLVCHYEASAEVCPVALVAEFRRKGGIWSAGAVLSNQCGN
jgi:hypothetical protein